uniref:heme lyase CcmF/NrfE family subunit n=1 Tax=Roseateles sp. TaxID=1971397 RepID=UPI00286A71A0
MKAEIGQLLLIIALLAAALQAWFGLSPQWQSPAQIRAQQRLVAVTSLWQALGVGGAMVLLAWAFVEGDYSVSYVAQHGHSRLPLLYRIAAVWGGHEGSMLLWSFALTVWGLVCFRGLRRHDPQYAARTLGLMGIIGLCVIGFVFFTSNPFERLLPAAAEGASLNPLLQDPGMALHPPLLYFGYVGTAVPFAMVLATLWGGSPGNWVSWARPYTASALALLSLGIALGSWWAYYELGWGGWWFWDPVENASLMPWLVLAALLHSQIACEQHGRFPFWTAWLAIGAFVLALLGTFLVRSGVLTSVHAFASDPRRGSVMLALIALALLGSFALVAKHGERLLPPKKSRPAAALSRDTALALNNLLLTAACACVLLGTLYPLLLDALRLGKLSVGPPYFDAVLLPLLLPALGLLAGAVWLRWGRDELGDGVKGQAGFLRRLRPTLWGTAIGAVMLPLLLQQSYGHIKPAVLLALLGAWAVGISSLHWAITRLRAGGLGAASSGMLLAHLGVAVFAVGVAMVKGYGVERDVRLAPGDTHQIADCRLSFIDISRRTGPNYEAQAGTFRLACEGRPAHTLTSEKRNYPGSTMPITESAIHWSLSRDIYVALGTPIEGQAWAVRVQVKPFIRWIWIGVTL